MNINRNNYEEYFLLYIDNELSVAGKNMVDAFVADNPDLGEELVMLQQSVLKTETVEFDQKENLLKPQPADELTEEKLLLLLDGELNDTEKNNTLSLINTNPAVKQEWELLQQTKLSPADNIIFDQKLLLYRKETKVVPMPWWRIAAAAVFIGAGLWIASRYFNTAGKSALPPAETVQAAPGKQSSGNNQNSISIPAGNSNKESAPAAVTVNAGTNTNHSKDETTGKHPVLQETDAQKDNLTVSTNDPGEPVTGLDALKEINNNDSNKKIDVSVSPETNIIKPESNPVTLSSLKNTLAANASPGDTEPPQVAYQSFDDEDENKPKRTKLGGFFKRVKRVLERKAKIKTGSDDEVRIANMSFAMH